ncbi:MAG: transcriptional regulator [Thermoplasmata archaeon]|nr:transcriptional regulator [Thermoplasmata archaeon]
MIEIKTGTMEEKIIKILQEFYPITVEEISKKLHVSKSNAEFELIKLQSKGIVEIEPLPGKTFVRLLRHDFTFVGRRHQKKFIKRKRSRIAEKEEDENDIMFG